MGITVYACTCAYMCMRESICVSMHAYIYAYMWRRVRVFLPRLLLCVCVSVRMRVYVQCVCVFDIVSQCDCVWVCTYVYASVCLCVWVVCVSAYLNLRVSLCVCDSQSDGVCVHLYATLLNSYITRSIRNQKSTMLIFFKMDFYLHLFFFLKCNHKVDLKLRGNVWLRNFD